ncbi:predicted protein [Sclerotinia sclerotiorum 1980 UF-70]|uniref:Uncharacterized protein n=1 Tax=Sclerotinia sclerotiorum (strain ATCC 18683 / 1980 / Ss-1) TaxID=665079 RepID=A7EHM2_SCLS1|nr:predicted protein [Sclerotinia sclerotiorum 1980 UF-70]EDO02338.1 predicted protein [Sclerotinia sclerotiorum 1980 UF-70]
MAALPQYLADEELRRASSSSIRSASLSHGRGGAGNIGTSPHDAEPVTLNTPTLKGDVYTTGRGGSGNMTKNTDPESARRQAQDVVGEAEIAAARKDARWDSAISDEDEPYYIKADNRPAGEKGLADKGKAWLKERMGKV